MKHRAASRDATLSSIETLVRLNDDARDGYSAAADLARSSALSTRLFRWAEERNEFGIALRRSPEVAELDLAPRGTRVAGAHRLWMGLRHFVGGDDDALLEECLRGEMSAIACYEHVLAHGNWEGRTVLRSRVAAQLSRVRTRARELEADLLARIGSRDRDSIQRLARVLVASHYTMSLATLGAEGPWASSVSYVHDGFTFYFLSDPASRHVRNIRDDARVAATINDDYLPWNEIRGIQLEGRAEIVTDFSVRADVIAKLFATFPFLHALRGDARALAAESSYALVKVVPRRVYVVDHLAGTHARFEIEPESRATP